MATDVVRILDALGYGSAQIAGHDRGGRVAYRLALDHPERVDRLALLSILPTLEMCERLTAESALTAYHWFFLAQAAPFPETVLGAKPDFFLDWTIGSWLGEPDAIEETAMNAYRAAFRDPAVIQAACEDYRAGLTLDLAHDRADRDAGKLITCPTHVIWGSEGIAARTADPLDIWKGWALDVAATPLPCGHFPAEERPQETLDALWQFFAAS
jgi:haloacetate dehalogenase